MGLRKNTDHRSSDQVTSEKQKKTILSVPSRDRIGWKNQATQLPKDRTTLPEQLLDLRIRYLSGKLSREEYQYARKKLMQSPTDTKPSKNRYAMISVLLVAATIIGIALYL